MSKPQDDGSVHLSTETAIIRLPSSSRTITARILGRRPTTTDHDAVYLDRLVHRIPGQSVGAYRCRGGVTTVLHGPATPFSPTLRHDDDHARD